MLEAFTFDDVLIVPKFSTIESRKDVSLNIKKLGLDLSLPVISANMDTVTDAEMCFAMAESGAVGCLHRFWDIETNVDKFLTIFQHHGQQVMCSVGLGQTELERADALVNVGCPSLVVDVANGASIQVVRQIKALRELFGRDVNLTVGNFATADSVKTFLEYVGDSVDGIKVGIGPGSACTTRIKTGCGYPQLSAILEISNLLKNTEVSVIADGGMKTPGDIAKALGAGAHMVMLGGMLAGTQESPGETVWKDNFGRYQSEEIVFPRKTQPDGSFTLQKDFQIDLPAFKKYRGSASKESYAAQKKDATWRTAEGESFYVAYKGPVSRILQDIEGGLRSAFSYVGARNLKEFHDKVEFVRVTSSTVVENKAHGDKK